VGTYSWKQRAPGNLLLEMVPLGNLLLKTVASWEPTHENFLLETVASWEPTHRNKTSAILAPEQCWHQRKADITLSLISLFLVSPFLSCHAFSHDTSPLVSLFFSWQPFCIEGPRLSETVLGKEHPDITGEHEQHGNRCGGGSGQLRARGRDTWVLPPCYIFKKRS
jgi:hypothetical protein